MATKADVQDAAELSFGNAVSLEIDVLMDIEHECWQADDTRGRAAIESAIVRIADLEFTVED
jgi:hypothetical protein